MLVRINIVLLSSVILFGCLANQEPLEPFVTQTLRDAQLTHARMPLFTPIQAIKFHSVTQGTPFSLPEAAQEHSSSSANLSCWQPKQRSKMPLERYLLSELQLKGVMGKGEQLTGLVAIPINQVVAVKVGQYIGENSGLVKQITPDSLVIHETLPDGLGCWRQRKMTLALK
ncbi:Pilus assembly protein, PilP [Vibrio thalassae]|uniref:Pilus assembly protein, PilP n=1 Tax=Vibrio thalassae TaxID=1243014 RepID=A0A240EMG8_9VIBR|nr:pilus assembly protein PilP [Vibrio thalassae]SNX49806.1 Pilus assembly protein, PilP [Vibrio thalassae]